MSRRNFLYGSHTLYYKSLLPLVLGLLERGEEVCVWKNRPDFITYSPRRFGKKPTTNKFVNPSALDFISKEIQNVAQWERVRDRLTTSFFGPSRGDRIFGVTKDLPKLLGWAKAGFEVYVVGYQHMPVLMSLGPSLKPLESHPEAEQLFLGDNDFSRYHRFGEYLRGPGVEAVGFANFLHLDSIGKHERRVEDLAVLIHPGGFRNVVTNPGDSKEVCYEKQRGFLRDLAGPILDAGLKPVVKVHPLCGLYHDKEDLEFLRGELVAEDSRWETLVIEREDFWKWAFRARIVVSFGSSSAYEFFAAGLKHLMVCDFVGGDRADKYQMFNRHFVTDPARYRSIFEKGQFQELYEAEDPLSQRIFEGYSALNTGRAVEQVLEAVC